jgi:hypothetical protein
MGVDGFKLGLMRRVWLKPDGADLCTLFMGTKVLFKNREDFCASKLCWIV